MIGRGGSKEESKLFLKLTLLPSTKPVQDILDVEDEERRELMKTMRFLNH